MNLCFPHSDESPVVFPCFCNFMVRCFLQALIDPPLMFDFGIVVVVFVLFIRDDDDNDDDDVV